MSINKLISIHNPIIDAMTLLQIDHDKFMPNFTRWAVLAEKEIGSSMQFKKKRAVLTVTNCVAKLPLDAAYVQIAILGDHGLGCDDLIDNACAFFNNVNAFGSGGSTFLVVDVAGSLTGVGANYGRVDYQIQDNKIVLNNCRDTQKLTIQYLAAVTDEDGFPKVGQNHVLAITWYIVWMYYFSKTGMNSMEYGKMNKAEQEWHRECSHARAQDGAPTDSDKRIIVAQLHNPYAGIGLSVGMYTTLGNTWSTF